MIKIKRVLSSIIEVVAIYYQYQKSLSDQERDTLKKDPQKLLAQIENDSGLSRQKELIVLLNFHQSLSTLSTNDDVAALKNKFSEFFQFVIQSHEEMHSGLTRAAAATIGLANKNTYLKDLFEIHIMTPHKEDEVLEACDCLELQRLREKKETLQTTLVRLRQTQRDNAQHLLRYRDLVVANRKAYTLPTDRDETMQSSELFFDQASQCRSIDEMRAWIQEDEKAQEAMLRVTRVILFKFKRSDHLQKPTIRLIYGTRYDVLPSTLKAYFTEGQKALLIDLLPHLFPSQNSNELPESVFPKDICTAYREFMQGTNPSDNRNEQLAELIYLNDMANSFNGLK